MTQSLAKAEGNVERENEIPARAGRHVTRAVYKSRAARIFCPKGKIKKPSKTHSQTEPVSWQMKILKLKRY